MLVCSSRKNDSFHVTKTNFKLCFIGSLSPDLMWEYTECKKNPYTNFEGL